MNTTRFYRLAAIVLAVACSIALTAAFAPKPAMADTLTTPKGAERKIEGHMKSKGAVSSYRTKGGKMVRNAFVTMGRKTYYFDARGRMATGWKKIGKGYYFFDRSTGVQRKGRPGKPAVVDGIKILKSGKAIETKYNKDKIELMMKARSIMLANTSYKDSMPQKRLKMFRWVMKGNYKQWRTLRSTGHRKGWEILFAKDMFYHGRWGCCVSNACAFAYLAKECGCKNVEICDDTGHAFVRIDGRYYDTLFAEVHGMLSYYNASKGQARKDGVVNSLRI